MYPGSIIFFCLIITKSTSAIGGLPFLKKIMISMSNITIVICMLFLVFDFQKTILIFFYEKTNFKLWGLIVNSLIYISW